MSVENVGCKELLFKRILLAITASIIVQLIFMSSVILIKNIDMTSPLSWFQDTWKIITCLKMWLYMVIFSTIIILQGIILSKNYLNYSYSPYAQSRFIIFCRLFTPHNLIIIFMYLISGIVLVWLHLALEDGKYSSLTKKCSTNISTTITSTCLVEEHLFLLLGSLWTGIYYFTKTNIFVFHRLQFPLIPLSKFTQVRRGISNLVPITVINAIWPTLYFIGLYYFIGSYLKKFIASLLFIHTEEQQPLDSIWRLLNLSLILHSWLYTSLFGLTINSMHLLFKAYLTEWMQFEIGQQLNVYNNVNQQLKVTITLPDALTMSKVPIIQHLGFLDLVTLAQKEKQRRAILFSLSQPGGHPYNWNCIVEKCLSFINNFAVEINSTVHPAGQQNDKVSASPSAASPTSLTSPTSPVTCFEKLGAQPYHMRNLINKNLSPTPAAVGKDITPTENCNNYIGQFIGEFIKSTRQNLISYLLSKPIIFYFFGKLNNNNIQYLMFNGQPIIWAVDGISSLAVASLHEDPYGIVQKDLPAIIETLLVLKQSLDKLHKMNMIITTKKQPHYDDKDVRQMLTSLRSANRRSIYRIVTKFKDYIDDLTLDQSVRDQLNGFFVCKE
ncbi:nucleoporin NDC1 [Microplitis mediator]|uniref:nucleoporin NDC1 n=1 Tax=Microplitis mediator TaxID=375433 RepID=UPI002553B9C8|nr:nucleoporin NDC1 [Microplitis mediator]